MSQDDHTPTPISPVEAAARFADAWVAAGQPDVRAYAKLVASAGQDAFYDLIEEYLLEAPIPPYSEHQLAEIRRKPAFVKAMDATIHLENLLNGLEVPEDLR